MMWTRDKSQKKDPMGEFERLCTIYYKIVKIIDSCTSRDHTESCYRIIDNFIHSCKNTCLRSEMYDLLIKNLKHILNYKISRLP
jgi:hypothetical protein